MLKTDMVVALLGHSYGLQQGGLGLTPATHTHHGYVVNLQLRCASVHFFPHPSLTVCSLNMLSTELFFFGEVLVGTEIPGSGGLYLLLRCHCQNGFCIKTGSDDQEPL